MAPDKLRAGSAAAAKLWNTCNADLWEEALNDYNRSIELIHDNSSKAQTKLSKQSIVQDRKWVDEKLTLSIRKQKFITLEELERLMVWKLRRGVYRPTLMSLIRKNSTESVEAISQTALSMIETEPEKVVEACKTLTELHGVGPATASLILSVVGVAAFMSDEAMDAVLGLPRSYTIPQFIKFQKAVKGKVAELSGEWTPDLVEKALFATAMIDKYNG